MANFVCFVAARAAKAEWNVREQGVAGAAGQRLTVYGSAETHTWIQKAADLTGLGTSAVRWIPTDASRRRRARCPRGPTGVERGRLGGRGSPQVAIRAT